MLVLHASVEIYPNSLARVAMEETPKDKNERNDGHSDEDVKSISAEES